MKTRKLIILAAVIAGLTLLLTSVVYSSGTYRPPVTPGNTKNPFSRSEIKYGEILVYGKALTGSNGKTCMSCHDKGRERAFSRYRLLIKSNELLKAINNCLTDQERSNGEELGKGGKKTIAIGAYIISRYRLPVSKLENLR